jgi:hypothetical protein
MQKAFVRHAPQEFKSGRSVKVVVGQTEMMRKRSGRRSSVNRWQALVEIVKSFNDRGASRLAFAAMCVWLIAPLMIALIVALKLGSSMPHLPWIRSG